MKREMRRKISLKAWLIVLLLLLNIILIIPPEITSKLPSIIGATIATVYVYGQGIPSTCVFNLTNGWNLISFACTKENMTVSSLLADINQNYISIHTYEPGEAIDKWKAYNPNMPYWVVQDLSTIRYDKGYWIKLNQNTSFIIQGNITLPNRINILQGWNLVGYPLQTQKTPIDAFSTINGKYSVVWTYDTAADTYLYYNPSLGTNTLTQIIPTKGYWINMTSSASWWVT